MNKVYERDMYNKETKEEFLSSYPNNTQTTYKRIFLKSSDLEEMFGKDLYDFNFKEIESVLYDLRPDSLSASKSNASIITIYIDWASDKTASTLNPLKGLKSDEFKKYIASKPKEMLKREEEIFSTEIALDNPQDKATLILLYLGVQGQGCEELLNLKAEDVDFENHILYLRDKNGKRKPDRELKIEHERADYFFNEIIKDAITEKRYYKMNNQMVNTRANLKDYIDLIDSDYIIRAAKTRAKDYNAPANKRVVYRRIAFMGEEFGTPSVKYIVRSGMLAMARMLWKRDGVLEDDQYTAIMDQYDFKNRNALKQIINIDVIKEIYGDDN